MPAIAASAVLVVVLVAGMAGKSDGSGASPDNDEVTSTSAAVDAGIVASSSTGPVVVDTAPAVAKTQLATTLSKGAYGEDVKRLQQRLTDLGFAPGPIDGQFGSGTQQAMWAYDKLVLKAPRADASSSVTNEMWQAMQDQISIAPRRPDNSAGVTHVEIYVPEQVLVVFSDNVAKLIAHISTGEQNPDGTPAHWCENVVYNTGKNGEPLTEPKESYECADAKTPGGIFKFTRRYAGKRVGPLGGMMNPVYFNYGIAVHGADNVPLEPASHGCVRLNQTIAKFFPDLVKNGDRVYVWGQDGKQPEDYSKNESLPSFNAVSVDPNATTTTSSTSTTSTTTTTTIAATTTVPATTAAPATTAKPVATTTTTLKPAATTVPETTPAPTTTTSPTVAP